MTAPEIFSILASNIQPWIWIALSITGIALIAMPILNKSKLKENENLWVLLGCSAFVAVTASGILGLAYTQAYQQSRHISQLLENPNVQIVSAEFKENGVQVTIKTPDETEIKEVLGSPIPTIKTPAKQAILEPKLVEALDKQNVQIAGKLIKVSVASLNP